MMTLDTNIQQLIDKKYNVVLRNSTDFEGKIFDDFVNDMLEMKPKYEEYNKVLGIDIETYNIIVFDDLNLKGIKND